LCVLWSFTLFNTYYILTGSRAGKVMTKEGGSSPIAWIEAAVESYEHSENTCPIQFWYQCLGAKPYPVFMHILYRPRPAPAGMPRETRAVQIVGRPL